MTVWGITQADYNALLGLGLDLNGYFSNTPQTDAGGNVFYEFTGSPDDWDVFLIMSGYDPGDYPLGLFTLLDSSQWTGNT